MLDSIARCAIDAAHPDATTVQTERLRRDAMQHTDRIIEVIRRLVDDESIDSLEALEANLAVLWPDLDQDRLAALIGEAVMASELAGRYEVTENQ